MVRQLGRSPLTKKLARNARSLNSGIGFVSPHGADLHGPSGRVCLPYRIVLSRNTGLHEGLRSSPSPIAPVYSGSVVFEV